MRTTILIAMTLTLAACGRERVNYVEFDGEFYQGRVSSDRADRHDFTASVRPVSQGLDGARLALAYEGTKHCVGIYGTSRIDWQVLPEEASQIDGETLSAAGTCVE